MSIAPISSNMTGLIQEALQSTKASPGSFSVTDNPGVQFGQTLASQIKEQGSKIGTVGGTHAVQPSTYQSAVLQMIDDTQKLQANAKTAVQNVIQGDGSSLHTAIIAMEEAGVSFQLLAEMRNKIVEGMQEMMRMQV